MYLRKGLQQLQSVPATRPQEPTGQLGKLGEFVGEAIGTSLAWNTNPVGLEGVQDQADSSHAGSAG